MTFKIEILIKILYIKHLIENIDMKKCVILLYVTNVENIRRFMKEIKSIKYYEKNVCNFKILINRFYTTSFSLYKYRVSHLTTFVIQEIKEKKISIYALHLLH